MRTKLGEYLRQLREERGLGIREVARRSQHEGTFAGSISPGLIVQIENGEVKRPGVLKLAALAEIYQIELASLLAFLWEDKEQTISAKDTARVEKVMRDIAGFICMIDSREADRTSPTYSADRSQFLGLIQDLDDVLERVRFVLVPALDGQPPIPLKPAQRLLAEPTVDGETRRKLLRLVLALRGEDLEDAAVAFVAAVPRAIRSTVLLDRPTKQEEDAGLMEVTSRRAFEDHWPKRTTGSARTTERVHSGSRKRKRN